MAFSEVKMGFHNFGNSPACGRGASAMSMTALQKDKADAAGMIHRNFVHVLQRLCIDTSFFEVWAICLDFLATNASFLPCTLFSRL